MLNRRVFTVLPLLAFTACRPADQGGGSEGEASIGGPFTLVDENGQTVDESVLRGQWSAIYFGFTYCPDICPTSLITLREGLDKLGARGRQVRTFLISVDPERDTPEAMKAYLDNPAFPEGIRGLTGTSEQVAEAARAYRVYYERDREGPDYLINHQSITYLMDPDGRFVRPLAHGLTPDEIALQIGDAMRQRG